MSIASISIRSNPVLSWEQFTLNLTRPQILAPRIEERDIGGFYSARFQIEPGFYSRRLASDLLSNGLMRDVRIFNHESLMVWEGFISNVIEDTGTAVVETNIQNVYNRQWARYNTGSGVARSTKYNDTDSQGRIGIKERVVVAGEVSLDVANQHINQLMNWTSYPSPGVREIRVGGGTREKALTISCLGYWHTLFWRTYNQTSSTGDANASVIISNIITDVGEFVGSTYIEDNVTQISQEFDTDRTAGEILQSIVSAGDSGYNRWIAGMRANREFYAMQAAQPTG